MGRGDRRTKKGKISAGSFGNSRPQKVKVDKTPKAATAAKVAKKAAPKKAAKKAAEKE